MLQQFSQASGSSSVKRMSTLMYVRILEARGESSFAGSVGSTKNRLHMNGVIWKGTRTYNLENIVAIRTHRHAYALHTHRQSDLDVIGDYPMLRRLAQFQIATKNEQFEVGNSPPELDF